MPPPSPHARRAVSAAFFLSGLCFATWASRIPDISAALGLSAGQLGRLLLAMPVGSLLALPLAGGLVHRWGSRRVVLLGAVLYAGLLPLLGLAGSFGALAAGLALFGAAGNLLNIAINTQAIGVQAGYGQPIMGTFHGLWSLAGFLGGALGTALIGAGQPPPRHFLLVAGLGLGLAAALHPHTLRHDPGQQAGGLGQALRHPDPYLLRIGLLVFCGMLCEGTMFDWSGVYFQRVVRPAPSLVTSGYVACMSTMALGRFLSDRVTQRVGPVRMLQISSALISTGLLTAVLLPTLGPALLGFLLVGFGIASVIPLAYGAAGQAGSVSPGVALALVSTIGYAGFLLGPPLVGLLAEALSLRASFAVVAGLGAVIGLLAAGIRRPGGAGSPHPLAPSPKKRGN